MSSEITAPADGYGQWLVERKARYRQVQLKAAVAVNTAMLQFYWELGADMVAKAAPDGYTLLVSAAGVISNSMIKKTMPFKDDALTPLVMIGLAPSVIVVPKNAPYNNLRDFVEK